MKVTIKLRTLCDYSEALIAAHSIVRASLENRRIDFDDVFRYCESLKSIVDELGEVSDFDDIGDFLRVVGEELVAAPDWDKVLANIGSATQAPDMTVPKDAHHSRKRNPKAKKK